MTKRRSDRGEQDGSDGKLWEGDVADWGELHKRFVWVEWIRFVPWEAIHPTVHSAIVRVVSVAH